MNKLICSFVAGNSLHGVKLHHTHLLERDHCGGNCCIITAVAFIVEQ